MSDYNLADDFKPLGYTMLVEVIYETNKFGTIEIPDDIGAKILKGRVLAVGTKVTMCKVGDIVVFRWTTGVPMDFVRLCLDMKTPDYKVMTEDEPLGIWEGDIGG